MAAVQASCWQRRELGELPLPLAGEGWGGGMLSTNLGVCPLPVPPAEVGCFRLRPVNQAAELGETRVRLLAGEGTLEPIVLCLRCQRVTMSFFMGARIATNCFCSLAGTLNLLRLLARSCTSASKSLPLMPMPACTDFMSRPV